VRADIQIGLDNGNPGYNVFWDNNLPGQVNGPAATVTGSTNGPLPHYLLDVTSIDGSDLQADGGQAPGVFSPDGTFGSVTIVPHGDSFTFNDLSVNVRVADNGELSVEVNGLTVDGDPLTAIAPVALDKNGQNRLRIQAAPGDETVFTSIALSSGPENNLLSLVQFRLGGIVASSSQPPGSGGPTATPEPASLALWGLLALGGAGFCWRLCGRAAAAGVRGPRVH
jgi:hypothetical protein